MFDGHYKTADHEKAAEIKQSQKNYNGCVYTWRRTFCSIIKTGRSWRCSWLQGRRLGILQITEEDGYTKTSLNSGLEKIVVDQKWWPVSDT